MPKLNLLELFSQHQVNCDVPYAIKMDDGFARPWIIFFCIWDSISARVFRLQKPHVLDGKRAETIISHEVHGEFQAMLE
jgi:hypothetical protein